MNTLKLALATSALALSAGTASASVYTYTGSVYDTEVKITEWPGTKPITGNTVLATSFNVTDNASPSNNFLAWCLDLAKTIAINDTFTKTTNPFAANGLNTIQMDRVQGIFDSHFDTAKLNAASAAAFQLVLWEAIYDDTLDLSGGNLKFSGISTGVATYFNQFTNFTLGSKDNYVVTYLQNDSRTGQDIVTASAIPLPAAAWLLIGGIGALVAVRRRNAA